MRWARASGWAGPDWGLAGILLVVLAAAATRALQGMLLDVSPLDAATFGTAIAVVMLLAGAGAAWGPARTAD